MFADAVVGLAVIAFALGIAAAGVIWALWHYVVSHITVGWQ
jgi:hypothetical protein